MRIRSQIASKVLAIDGTATAPSISFASDPDTGFRLVASNQMAFISNAENRINLDYNQTNFSSDHVLSWGNTANAVTNTPDVLLRRDSANILALRNGTNAQTLRIGEGNTALAAGRLAMGRDAAAGVAPGAGYGMMRWEAGTNANTLKLVAYAGTSTTGVTIVDNVGAGN